MHPRSIRVLAVAAVAMVTALAGAHRASADGAVFIDSCQTLTDNNTTYKLTTDLTSCNNCLVVDVSKITIDLQGHSITSECPGVGAAITDLGEPFDLIVVKNGSVSGYNVGVRLPASTRVTVLGVTAKGNRGGPGIVIGPQGLVKSSEVAGNLLGIIVGDRSQVQQCNVHNNQHEGIKSAGNCLITMNTASANQVGIDLGSGNKCTVSYNTASHNTFAGIRALGTGHLVTHNVAMNNGFVDYVINCPSDVTNNDSTDGFPDSYDINGTGCHFVNND
jgi:parallel beta-helix repeat protein